ncbi:hypothetical protein P22_0822 [Propionispora sp. 2/2-37]|nr:hypothetical protein P22_0822 [Propionispora sp. 2/2-37]
MLVRQIRIGANAMGGKNKARYLMAAELSPRNTATSINMEQTLYFSIFIFKKATFGLVSNN